MDKSCHVTGVAVSSLDDVQEAIDFAISNNIRPIVHVFPMERAEDVFQDLVRPSIIYLLVLLTSSISKLRRFKVVP